LAHRHALESPFETETRLRRDRHRHRESRDVEDPVNTATRLQHNRERMAASRAIPGPTITFDGWTPCRSAANSCSKHAVRANVNATIPRRTCVAREAAASSAINCSPFGPLSTATSS
jgi:hypothetical protein